MKRLVLLFAILGICTSCTDQQRVRNLGGRTTINLADCEKLLNVTWKEEDLWFLTRRMTSTDTAETYTFRESSSYGLMQGTVVIREQKKSECGG